MSEEKFEYVDKLSVDLTIAKASIELNQRVNVLLNILEQERTAGFRQGYVNALLNGSPREWIPLTEQEIGELYRAGWSNNMDFARAIEAKLKEKNGKI